jgi:hypothetical protein
MTGRKSGNGIVRILPHSDGVKYLACLFMLALLADSNKFWTIEIKIWFLFIESAGKKTFRRFCSPYHVPRGMFDVEQTG